MAAAPDGEQVYATLLLSDSYLPGALVLGHSLRDAGTTKKLAVLVTLDSVSADAITKLQAVYDYILPVPRIRNDSPANLYLMNRGDLHSAFTKLNLWKQTQFSKIVYIDADVVAFRAPDELFTTPHAFAAAPDIGWPDLFNSGVMVLTPNMGDYYAMMAMADRGISFDGADQGLLNMYFKNNFHRLSFTYNVTPSAHYQYVPAYRHFQSSINMVHFIGSNKPWFAGRNAPHNNGPFDEMVGRWWAVYDRHYRVQEKSHPKPQYVQYFTQGEFQPAAPSSAPAPSPHPTNTGEHIQQGHYDPGHVGDAHQSSSSATSPSGDPPRPPEHSYGGDQGVQGGTSDTRDFALVAPLIDSFGNNQGTQAEARPEQQDSGPQTQDAPAAEEKHQPPPVVTFSWDAQRYPPPADSKPEAMNFPSTHYEMSQDSAQFVPPERYPSPPRNMWYEVPKEPPAPPAHRPRQIFPWEVHQPTPSRTFAETPGERDFGVLATVPPGETPTATGELIAPTEQSTIGNESTAAETTVEPATPTTPSVKVTPADPWTSFSLSNAWDEVPEINRYVDGLQKHRRIKSSGSAGAISSPLGTPGIRGPGGLRFRGLKLTDFPSAAERPSLPVTPAPIARPSFWGDEGEHDDGRDPEHLPAAEGVPAQAEWDPEAQLQKLARQQYEALLRKLGGQGNGEGSEEKGETREIPKRSLPFGSEDVRSLSHIVPSAPSLSRPTPGPGREAPVAPILTKVAEAITEPTLPTGRSETSESSVGATLETIDTHSTLLESPMPRPKDERT